MIEPIKSLTERYDPNSAELSGGKVVERRLSQLKGSFADEAAYAAALEAGDPLLYRVTAVEPGKGDPRSSRNLYRPHW